jgi:hypothetical protein
MARANEKPVAYIVSGQGTDEEIAARCAEAMPDWPDLTDKVRGEIVRLMRYFWSLDPAPAVAMEKGEDGKTALGPPAGANVTLWALRLVETWGSNSNAYGNHRLGQLGSYFAGDNAEESVSAALAFVRGANANDPVQSSLAVQMTATHDAAMKALRRVEKAEWVEQAQVFGNLACKLLNAYTRQAETLAKLQRGGEQVIKHVHIDNRGGQAVVTDHIVAGGQNGERRGQPYEQSAFGAALPGQDPSGYGVPIAGDARQEAMQAARGAVAGRATGESQRLEAWALRR